MIFIIIIKMIIFNYALAINFKEFKNALSYFIILKSDFQR